jgi:hypothetical protein
MEHACLCNNRQIIGAWPMFPVHPKFAALFMKGVPLIKGFKLGADLCNTFPAEYAEEHWLFEHQFHVGVANC